jgi:altronate hydrolase
MVAEATTPGDCMQACLRLNALDNVAVALRGLGRGSAAMGVELCDDIPAGHKFALGPIRVGEAAIKYGFPIGLATADITPGQHVHTHNLCSALDEVVTGTDESAHQPAASIAPISDLKFQGFRRLDGSVGIRNEIWIINTVACVNQAAQQIALTAGRELELGKFGVDGVYTFPHPFGCSQLGDDLAKTQSVLAGLVRHANAAAILILGLGCENNRLSAFLEKLGPPDRDRVRYFNAQEVSDEIEDGVKAVGGLAEYASQFRREQTPVSELIVGAKCGGSDGFSGITANPLVGRVSDRLTSRGATVLLTEVPEMFGAEAMLLRRAADERVSGEIVKLVNDFRWYFRSHNQPIDENPAPGNKDGGITTLAEKSLGCVQKAGTAPIRSVVEYGTAAQRRAGGVALVNAPGNDGVSGTALSISGANLILFTTGRGTPMGFPAPTLKISTNSDLAGRKPRWIDFDAGRLLDDSISPDALAEELLQLVLAVASGQQTRAEQNNCREIAMWKDGVTV